jgi:serine/threonine protein kinase
MVAFAVVGSVGTFIGLCAILWFVYSKFCGPARQRSRRVYDSEQQQSPGNSPPSPRRQASNRVSRQRSGPSSGKTLTLSMKRGEQHPEEFSLRDLAAATNDFSTDCKIGSGSFGTVYKATLADGREVAIKRAEIRPGAKKYQDKLSAFDSELSFLSRLHHKHLVGLVGYCEEEDEDEHLLVYEYMPNGSLYDHLHKTQDLNPVLNSWLMRIKIALDAARGIEYLHTYAVPPIIHRDIKSSNILLDGSWSARVSDFGLSLMGPNDEDSHLSLMAAGTVGYMDPEYYRMQHLTPKSDVYSFGVVLLELLTGKKAIHKHDGSGGPRNVVDYALPHIAEDDFPTILDPRLSPPRPYEIEAVTFVGYTAVDCVSLEGKDRPSMTEVVGLLEKALALCAASLSRGSSLRSEQRL